MLRKVLTGGVQSNLRKVDQFLWLQNLMQALAVVLLTSPFLTRRQLLWLMAVSPLLKSLIFVSVSFAWSNACGSRHRPLGWRRSATLFLVELATFAWLFHVSIPLGPLFSCGPFKDLMNPFWRRGKPKVLKTAGNFPVLFLHGYFCNKYMWITSSQYMNSKGMQHLYLLDMEPFWGSIHEFAEQTALKVDEILSSTGHEKIILVGGSMGGLVARTYVQFYGGSSKVLKVITVGSPHNGTRIAEIAFKIGLLSPNGDVCVKEMVPKSAFLTRLNEMESKAVDKVPITSIFSHHDNFISPQDSSELDHAHCKNVPVFGVGHVSLAVSPMISQLVCREIMEASWRWKQANEQIK